MKYPRTRGVAVGRTYADARDTLAEGESGLVPILRRYDMLENYNRSIGELVLRNGSRIKLMSADEPDRFRGVQFHWGIADELAAWENFETWDMLQFCLRLGDHPQLMVTTTPRPVKVIKDLLSRDDGSVVIVRGSTFDNAANLAPSALAELRNRYEGTRLGRQELYAELLVDVPGALWTFDMIESYRVHSVPDMTRIVVAVDPATTDNPDSDETGIVVCGKGVDKRGYTLKDASCHLPVMQWAQRVINVFDEFKADTVVGERQGTGDFLETVLRQIRPGIPFKEAPAKRGKILRAQPISSLAEQGRLSMVGYFPELEEQMLNYTGEPGEGSPDRLDAYVHAITALDIGMGGSADRILGAFGVKCVCGQFSAVGSAVCGSCGARLGS